MRGEQLSGWARTGLCIGEGKSSQEATGNSVPGRAITSAKGLRLGLAGHMGGAGGVCGWSGVNMGVGGWQGQRGKQRVGHREEFGFYSEVF